MKKFAYIIIAASAAILAFSCTKENGRTESEGESSLLTFTAIADQTKTELSEGHTVWSEGDQIKVFYTGGSAVAPIKTGEGSSSATFQAAVPDGDSYYAVYPAALQSSSAAGVISVEIPNVQSGIFGDGHVAVAKGVDKTFHFSNSNSFLKITLPKAGYTRIVVESPAGGALSGTLNADLTGDSPVVTPASGANSSVEAASPSGFPAGDVYLSVFGEVTHSAGLLVKYYDASGEKGGFYLDKEVQTELSVIHSFGEMDLTGDYFVSLEGSGNKMGLDEANAMDLAAFKAFMTSPEDDTSFAAWAAVLDGATIHLAPGTYDLGDALLLEFSGTAAPVSISFVGNNTVITGNEEHRLLTIGENAKASFKNIRFENGLSYVSRNAPVLIQEGGEASFEGCVFNKNANRKEDGNGFNTGGCIYAEGGTALSFDNCEFTQNKGSYGATFLTKGEATIKNSLFQYNNGTWPRSAMYLDSSGAVVEMINCVVADNTVTPESGQKPDGGAIAITQGELTMTGCSLLRNSIPGRRGGALRLSGSNSYAKLIDCTVKENTADWGGAINVADSGVLEIEGGLYEGNYARGGGCILTSGTSSVSIKDALFKENYLPKNGRFGGAIRHESEGELTILRTRFEGNYTLYDGEDESFGGAVSTAYGQGDATVTISDCSFIRNHTKSGGGSALSYQSHNVEGCSGWMKVSNTLFQDNYCEYSGDNNENYGRHAGAVRLGHDGTDSFFDNCSFINNYTGTLNKEVKSSYGGAITYYADGMGYFNNCRFENNRATRGGAISVWYCLESGIFLNACSFSGNWISYRNGTSIYFDKAKYFCMNNCSFADNTYTQNSGEDDGSWVYVSGDTDKVLEECVISNCSLIGSCRTTESLDPLAAQELIHLNKIKDGKNYALVNNILVAGNDQYSWWANDSGINGYYNVLTKKGGNSSYSGSGDVEGKSSADFGALAWDATYFIWTWDGTLSGGFSGITASAFASALNSASPDFKTWLQEIGALDKDQLGNARGSGAWWPGAYQKN